MDYAPALGSDKGLHAAAGAAIGASADAVIAAVAPAWLPGWARRAAALAVVAAAGVTKEALDARDPAHHTVELWDALATIAGGVGGVGAADGSAGLLVAVAPVEGGAGVVVSFRW